MPATLLNASLKKLALWFETHHRALPWRRTYDPYHVWLSEIMLQQTQVTTVIPYFERFTRHFPNVEALAQASEADVLKLWSGLGYYRRARSLHAAAKAVVVNGGALPETLDGWLELPGIGRYTAGAISSIALEQAEPILDGNVERVLSRMRLLSREALGKDYLPKLWALAERFVKTAQSGGVSPRVFNQSLMEIGALVCTPKNPSCSQCPLSRDCLADREGRVTDFPEPKPRRETVRVQEHTLFLRDGSGRVLLRRRAAPEWRAGTWDLPMLSVDSDLPLVEPHSDERIVTNHVVTHHKIERTTYLASDGKLPKLWKTDFLRKLEGELKWVYPAEIAALPIGAPVIKLLSKKAPTRNPKSRSV